MKRSIVVAVALAASLACVAGARAEETFVPKGDYQVAFIELAGKVEGKTDPWKQSMIINVRENKGVGAWVPFDVTVPDASGVTLSGGQLKGEVVDRQVGIEPGAVFKYTLDASVADGKIGGSFSAVIKDGTRVRNIKGTLGGAIKSAEQLRKDNAVDPKAAWAGWRGPNGNLASAYTGSLVANLARARLAWKGEEEQPGSPGRTGGLGRKLNGVPKTRISGGGATAAVGEGKVIVSYYYPSGNVLDKRAVDTLGASLESNKLKAAVSADDIVLCLDAATGQTLWKTTFKDKGMNWQEHKCSPNNMSPVIHNGKAFAIGSTLRLYCVDLATGKQVWESNLGPRHAALEKAKADGLAKQAYQGDKLGNRHLGGAPLMIGGVLVTNDMKNDVCGFDPATGKEMWRAKGVSDNNAPVARWTHNGQEYAIASVSKGVTCISPADGKVVWTVPIGIGGSDSVVNVSGNYLVAFGLNERQARDAGVKPAAPAEPAKPAAAPAKGEKAAKPSKATDEGADDEAGEAGPLICLELSLTGAKQLWSTPAGGASSYAFPHIMHNAAIISGRTKTEAFDLATGKRVAEIEAAGAGNAGHMLSAGDTLLVSQDGKHGTIRLVTLTFDGKTFKLARPDAWTPQIPNTTAYGHTMATYPIVDGRMFIRGGDAIYCFDLRK